MKIHVAINIKTKKILSMMKATDEHVHDIKALPELVENIIKSKSMTTIGKLFADEGTYDGNSTCLFASQSFRIHVIIECMNFLYSFI